VLLLMLRASLVKIANKRKHCIQNTHKKQHIRSRSALEDYSPLPDRSHKRKTRARRARSSHGARRKRKMASAPRLPQHSEQKRGDGGRHTAAKNHFQSRSGFFLGGGGVVVVVVVVVCAKPPLITSKKSSHYLSQRVVVVVVVVVVWCCL
jgi:hypothetical protein